MHLPQSVPLLQPELTVTLTYRLPIAPGGDPFTAIQELLASLNNQPQALKASVMHTKFEPAPTPKAKVLSLKKNPAQGQKVHKK